jgi:hypothetical protein
VWPEISLYFSPVVLSRAHLSSLLRIDLARVFETTIEAIFSDES